MSLDLPAAVKRDLEKYAKAEHISPTEAAVKFIQSGLKASKRKPAKGGEMTEADWEKLKQIDPGFEFFEKMPDQLIDDIEKISRTTRAQRLNARA